MKALLIVLMVLGLMGIAVVGVCGGNEGIKEEMIAQERTAKEMAPPATSIKKVVIGVLDFEIIGSFTQNVAPEQEKKALMKELKRAPKVKLVDIPESCSLSDLKRNGYEQAEKYKMNYQLDMILHIITTGSIYHLRLIDLYAKKDKRISITGNEANSPIQVRFRGVPTKLLVRGDLNRVLKAKKKVLGEKEVALPREVEGTPEEIEAFLIQNGPRLIAEDEYSQVLELIEDLPGKRRRDIQIQTIGCFANLKGWVSDKDKICKLSWWKLRERLIHSGDEEATPMLVIFLKD